MAGINLLPWRESLRKKRLKLFGIQMGIAFLVAAVAAGYWHMRIAKEIAYQESRNQFIRNEISKVDDKIKEIAELEKTRNQLISRMGVIQDLQVSRPQAVHLFDELVETIPDGAFLLELNQTADLITLTGSAQSNARVSSYMRNIDNSEWIGNAQLQVIEQADAENDLGLNRFRLIARQISPATEEQ